MLANSGPPSLVHLDISAMHYNLSTTIDSALWVFQNKHSFLFDSQPDSYSILKNTHSHISSLSHWSSAGMPNAYAYPETSLYD